MFQQLDFVTLISFLTVVVARVVRREACTINDTMCKDIQKSDGYMFLLEPNKQSPVLDVEITQNGTQIVYSKDGNMKCSSEVVQCDIKSITTRSCNSVEVKFIHDDKEGKISESCLIFNTTEDIYKEDIYKDTHSSTGLVWLIIGIVVVVVVVVVGIGWFLWRKKGKGRGAAFPVCPCFNRNGNSDSHEDKSGEENERNYQQEQQQLLERESGNKESKSGTIDVSINMDPDKTITNDSVPRVNGVLPQKGLNGNMGHDPGGGKDTEQACNGNLQNCGQRTLDEQRKNGCRSSCNQRSAREEAFDETAGDEGQALVDSSGPGNECTTPPHVEKDTHHKDGIMLNNIIK